MIYIEYEARTHKFVFECGQGETKIVSGLPERTFRKGSKRWAAPANRRNVEYMSKRLNNPQMFSVEALAIYNDIRNPKEIVKEKEQMPDWHTFKMYDPMNHQDNAFKKFYGNDEVALFFEQGLGKTYTAINLAAAWRATDLIEAVIVVCPTSVKLVWEEELEAYCNRPYKSHVLSAGKYKACDKFTDILTDMQNGTTDQFKWLIVGIEGFSQGKAFEHVLPFAKNRKCLVIIDESDGIKTPGKNRTNKCIELGTHCVKRMILSGTPITLGMEDLYTQFKFLNPEIIGYNNYYSFRAHFCITTSIKVSEDKYVEKITGYKNQNELLDLVAPYTLRVEKADALDLPEKISTKRFVTMSPDQKRMYNMMRDEFAIEMNGREYEVKSSLEQLLRLQQITGGHYPEDTGASIQLKPIPGKNPKLEELIETVNSIRGKVIVWCLFRAEIEMIADAMDERGIGTVEFHGGRDDDEKKQAVREFREHPEVKVFLATKAAARGLTLIEGDTAIYYSLGHSYGDYAQSQDRIHRIGQKNTCNYIHLVCEKTVDVKVANVMRDRKNVADMIYSIMKEE